MMLLAELTYIHIYHKLYKNPKVLELCLPLFTDLAKYGTPPIVDYNCLDFPLENPLPGNPWEAGDFFWVCYAKSQFEYKDDLSTNKIGHGFHSKLLKNQKVHVAVTPPLLGKSY
jgi:hypothetical protein